jgi:putative transposase
VVKNMFRLPAPAPAPERPGEFLPNGAAAKAGLNRSISDAGWAQFTSILRAKAEEAGRIVVGVNPRHTSQTCNACGHVDARHRVSQAEFRCLACGHTANADVNAAKNILGAGLALLAGQVSQKEAVGF